MNAATQAHPTGSRVSALRESVSDSSCVSSPISAGSSRMPFEDRFSRFSEACSRHGQGLRRYGVPYNSAHGRGYAGQLIVAEQQLLKTRHLAHLRRNVALCG